MTNPQPSPRGKPSPRGTPGERALWTFLLITLVAPALAALVILLASIISGLIGRGPPSLLALDHAGQFAWAAQKALETYIWSAIPAAIAGAITAVLVYTQTSANWLVGATIGAVAVSIPAALAGGMLTQHLTPVAFIGAIVGIAMIHLLRKGRMLD